MKIETIHVYLPEEAVDCWVPCRAEYLGGDRYRILDDAPGDPVWQYGKGDVVRCRIQKIGPGQPKDFKDELVAYELADMHAPGAQNHCNGPRTKKAAQPR